MVRISLGLCLVLLVASSMIYEAQGIFLLRRYLRKKFPQKSNEFTPYANKGMILLVNNLESGCPKTAEFKNFFTEFKGYIAFIETASATSKNVNVELETKCDGVINAMSTLSGGDKSPKKSRLAGFRSTMLSMAMTLIQLKKSAVVMTLKQKKELIFSMVKWTRTLASSVKTASEKKGQSIDITVYQLDVNVNDQTIISGSSSSESGTSSSTKKGSSSENKEAASSSKKGSSSEENEDASSSKKGSSSEQNENASSSKKGSSSEKNENAPSSKKGTGADSEETSSKNKESNGSTSAKKESGKAFKDTTGGNFGSPRASPPSS